MDITTIITTAGTALGTLLTTAAVLAPKWKKLKKAYGTRGGVRVAILCRKEQVDDAAVFEKALEDSGYEQVTVTCSSGALADADIVILWHPSPDDVIEIAEDAEGAAPRAYQLVLTHVFLPRELPLGEKRVLSNSQIRLRIDLAAASEAVG